MIVFWILLLLWGSTVWYGCVMGRIWWIAVRSGRWLLGGGRAYYFPSKYYTFSIYDRTYNAFMYRFCLVVAPMFFFGLLLMSMMLSVAAVAYVNGSIKMGGPPDGNYGHRTSAKGPGCVKTFFVSQNCTQPGRSASTRRFEHIFAVSSLESTRARPRATLSDLNGHTMRITARALHARIATRSVLMPTMFITRVRL